MTPSAIGLPPDASKIDPIAGIDRAFASAIRGARTLWPAELSRLEIVDIALGRLKFHGIAALIGDGIADAPQVLVAAKRDGERIQTLWEASHRRAVMSAIESLAQAGVRSLVLKGTAPPTRGGLASFVAKLRAARGWRATQAIAGRQLWPPAHTLGLADGAAPLTLPRARIARLGRILVRQFAGGTSH